MSAGQNLIGREYRMCQYVQHQRCRCSTERSYQCPQCLQCTNYNRCSLDAPVSSKQNNNKLLFSSTSVMLIMSVKTGRYFFLLNNNDIFVIIVWSTHLHFFSVMFFNHLRSLKVPKTRSERFYLRILMHFQMRQVFQRRKIVGVACFLLRFDWRYKNIFIYNNHFLII